MTEPFNTNRILVSGTGKMGTPLMIGIENDDRYDLLPFAISEDVGNVKTIEFEKYPGIRDITLIRSDEKAEVLAEIWHKYGPFFLIEAVPKSTSQANIDFFSRFDFIPLIAMSSGIKDQSKSHNTLFLANSCLQIMAWEKFIAEQKENMFGDGYSLDILEAHQETKEDVSFTAIKMIPRFNRLGLQFEEKQIVSIRGEEGYLRIGIPRMFWGAHAFHQYTITSERKDDEFLTAFFGQMVDYFRKNTLFKNLFYFDLSPKSNENCCEKMFFWGNNTYQDTPYRTFMFGVQLILTETQTKVEICHSIFGHEPYVQGVVNNALPFMQEKCYKGLTGENFSSIDLYDWVMKPPTADEFIRRKGVYNPDQWTPCPSNCAYCNDSFFGHAHPHSTQNWIG